VKVDDEHKEEVIYNGDGMCPFCGAVKGEPHGEHKFV